MSTKKNDQEPGGFSAEERAAMKERARELKAESQRGTPSKKDGEGDVLAKIAEVPEPTWYGMPAYALDGKVVCFFQSAKRFDSRYATLGFGDAAELDEGDMWPISFALKELTPAVEDMIAALVKKAPG
jgi:uncharacterized protein YdhG (YjbR/CyaY superfamily)